MSEKHWIWALKERLAEAEARVETYRAEMNALRGYLHSDKFAGVDSDGERKDWIATADVLNWLREVELEASKAHHARVVAKLTELHVLRPYLYAGSKSGAS